MNGRSESGSPRSGFGALAGLPRAADPDRPAVYPAGDAPVTFGTFVDQIDEVADRFEATGVGPGDRVAIVLPASTEAITAMFAAWQVGAVAVPVNPRLTAAEQDRHLDRAGATFRHDAAGTAPCAGSIADAIDSGRSADTDDTDDTALVLTTSGTTGTPKPVELAHTKVLDGIDTVLRSLRGTDTADGPDPTRPPAPNLVPVPLSLWAGTYQVLFAFRAGNPVVLLDPFTPAGFAAAVRHHSIRSTVLAPAMMAALNDDPAVTDLTPLRMVRSITAPLSVHHARRFHERFGVTVLNSYGQTELGGEVIGWTAADTREHGQTHLGAVGRPHPGVSACILDPDPDGIGELAVRAPSMTTADEAPELADRITEDGHLRTGDIARIDDDGFVWLTGRVSDLIIRGGLKVWPDDVEEALRHHPQIAEAAVVGMADERLGQVPWAFVVPAGEGSLPPEEDLDAHCRSHLAAYKVPTRFVAVDHLPRNEVGKLLRRQLIEEHTL